VERVPSSAFTQPETTYLGRYFAEGVTANPGKNGFVLLDTGEQALRARIAVIEVADNGLGWPTPNRERLTEPYMTTREKGTGLGLAIVKRVMEDHNGRLELDIPRSGQGAVVRLVFPLADMADPAPQSLKEA